MPRLATFDGIVVAIYAADHAPPHVHAYYAEHEVLVVIATSVVLAGSLPSAKLTLVLEWLEKNRSDVLSKWNALQAAVR
jgi:hypothetical protein